jgi:putative ABC transport system permease protein
VDTVWQDLRYALRVLRKNPGFTAVAIATLAIGIGANTAIFSVVNAVLLRNLPFPDPNALVLVTERMPTIPIVGPSWLNFQDLRDRSRSLDLAPARNSTMTLTGAGDPERLQAQQASAALFPLLGVQAIRGHTFTKDEDKSGAAPVALIGYGFWQRRFGGAADTIGKAITLDRTPYTVVGILPPSYQLIQPADVAVPFHPWAATLPPDDRSWHPGIIAVGRLRPGVSFDAAKADMTSVMKNLEREYPAANLNVGINVKPMHDQLVENIRPALLVLLGAVGAVLLIACANIANLLLARATARRREIAMRTAIGAGRGRLVRQLLTESVLLAVAGGGMGVLIAHLSIDPLVALAGSSIPNVGPVQVDYPVLGYVCGIVMLAGILFGLGPAVQSVRFDLVEALNEGSRGSTGGGAQKRLRGLLVVSEIAFAIVLLIGAGLLLKSFDRLQSVAPGFRPGNLLVADVPVSPRAYPTPAARMDFYDRVLDRARALPGVTAAGAAAFLPVSGGGSQIHFNIQARPPKGPGDFLIVAYRPITPKLHETLGVPLLRGRYFTDADTERGPAVAVVNEAFVKQYFPNQNPLGQRLQLGQTPESDVPWHEIVGVVGNVRQNLATDAAAEMYFPIRQANALLPVNFVSVVLRTAGDPRTEVSALRAAVRELDPNQPLVRIRTMEENIGASVAQPRFRTTLLGIFAGCALLLSVVGLYGVMTYSVSRRASEIGIRMALGAQRGDILRMVLGEGLRLAVIGVAIGAVGAVALTRLLATFLFATEATDAVTFAGAAGLLIAVALLACYVPARRAMQLDPVTALRWD